MKKVPEGLVCPACSSELSGDVCDNCGHRSVFLGDVLCVFPSSEMQLRLWRHVLHSLQQSSHATTEYLASKLARGGLLPATRKRFEATAEASVMTQAFMLELFARAGVTPKYDEAFDGAPVDIVMEYFYHIARDWSWQGDVSGSCPDQLETLLGVWPKDSGNRVLMLGSGAGRVAWDLHCTLENAETTTLELNPALQLAANQLINGCSLPPLPESCVVPQMGREEGFKSWELLPPKGAGSQHVERFHQLVGDIWQLEFLDNSFDCIVTSWFVDAHGRDSKALLQKISKCLKPGGYWVNTGPLLYPEPLDIEFKYSHKELKDLMAVAKFEITAETSGTQVHMPSPLEVRKKQEEVWTFCAQYQPYKETAELSAALPEWLVLLYLPISQSARELRCDEPAVNSVLDLVDGQRSIRDLAGILNPEALEDTCEALVGLFTELLAESPHS